MKSRKISSFSSARFEDCFPEVVQVVVESHPDIERPRLASRVITRHVNLSSLSLSIFSA
jgi:hypothetical protein